MERNEDHFHKLSDLSTEKMKGVHSQSRVPSKSKLLFPRLRLEFCSPEAGEHRDGRRVEKD